MSFKTASAILRGRWLVDKKWADAHMPLIHSFLKGDASAAALILGNSADAGGAEMEDEAEKIQGTKNVYEICPSTDLSKVPHGSIVKVDIDGPMMKEGDICSYGMCDYADLFMAIKNAENISGVILDVDSPGGQVDGTATLADAIKACTEVKPVIGFVNDGMSASASYWILSACSEIYVSQQTDMVGSIGVYCTIADFNAYYESQGLPVKEIYAPQSSDKNGDVREAFAGNEEPLKAELAVIADAFIGTVKKNRKGKISGTDWSTGKMYFPDEAQQLGLIDGVKSFEQVVFRISRMISTINKQNSNTMAFEKVLTVLNAEKIELAEGGFLLQEDHLTVLNTALEASEQTIADLTQGKQAAEAALTSAQADLATEKAEVENLKAEIDKLKRADAGRPTEVAAEKDPVNVENEDEKYLTSADAEKKAFQKSVN